MIPTDYRKNSDSTLQFVEHGDERGRLVVIEGGGFDIPFEIKRVFYIYGSEKNVVRGRHANRLSEFILINVAGTSKVMLDTGFENSVIALDRPHKGVYIPKMVWKEMYDFSSDAVLLCLASEHYDSGEYIRDYEEFSKEAKYMRIHSR